MDKSKEEIIKVLQKEAGIKEITLEIPPNPELGDYAFPCFTLAKTFKKAPAEIAEDLARKIPLSATINKIEVKGPYLNFFVNKEDLSKNILQDIIKKNQKWT